jgi:pSer/pThr/pTyr-binding forkhead associated (FHA) protein
MAKLILSLDGMVLREYPLTKERTTIGRKSHNDIVIDNLAVSGEHAMIMTILNDSFLEDLGSTNGTLVNSQPIKKHFLQNNDVVELGKYKLKYVSEAVAQPASAEFEKTMVLRAPAGAVNAEALAKGPEVSQPLGKNFSDTVVNPDMVQTQGSVPGTLRDAARQAAAASAAAAATAAPPPTAPAAADAPQGSAAPMPSAAPAASAAPPASAPAAGAPPAASTGAPSGAAPAMPELPPAPVPPKPGPAAAAAAAAATTQPGVIAATGAQGTIQILSGPSAGKELPLSKPLTTLGKPGVQVAVIAKRPQGYFITHVEGASFPVVNGKQLDAQAHALSDHDVIELAGVKMEFFLKPAS